MNWTALLAGAGGPFLAAVFGVAGVVLGRYIAQGVHKEGEGRLSSKVNLALTVLFSLFVVAFVMKDPTVDPLRLLGYGSGAGFVGLPVLEFLADQLSSRFKSAWDGFMNPDDNTRIDRAMRKLDKLPPVGEDDGPPGDE